MPPPREIEWGERVWIDREETQTVIGYVGRHVPPDPPVSFHLQGGQAWVQTESDVDLERLVAEALADTGGNR